MAIVTKVFIVALFEKIIMKRYCKAKKTAHCCCMFGHFDLLYYEKLDALCGTMTKLDAFVALQAFDTGIALLKHVC